LAIASGRLAISRQEFVKALGPERGNQAFQALDAQDGTPGNGKFNVRGYVRSVEARIAKWGVDAILGRGIGAEVEGLNSAEYAARTRGLPSAPKFTAAESIIAHAAAAALERKEGRSGRES
jgi:hypothetical protein